VVILESSLSDYVHAPSPRTEVLHWFLPDPVGQPLEVYREVRDQIEVRVLDFIERVRKAS